MTKRKIGICIYCGQKRRLTRDHIPPKNLFPMPRPDDLVTVPSCLECNKGAEQDDEYFRMVLVMRDKVGNHAEARKAWEVVLRSLKRTKASGLRASLLASTYPVQLRSQSGLFLGRRTAYDIDIDRLNRVVTRVVKGLFFHERGYHLPATHEASGAIEPPFDSEDQSRVLLDQVLGPLLMQPETEIGNGVFSYRFLFSADEPNVSVWLMRFYQRLPAMGVTLPVDSFQPT